MLIWPVSFRINDRDSLSWYDLLFSNLVKTPLHLRLFVSLHEVVRIIRVVFLLIQLLLEIEKPSILSKQKLHFLSQFLIKIKLINFIK
jgi:hypothetical protein